MFKKIPHGPRTIGKKFHASLFSPYWSVSRDIDTTMPDYLDNKYPTAQYHNRKIHYINFFLSYQTATYFLVVF